MLPLTLSSPASAAGEVAAGERAEVEPGEAEQQLFRAPARRQQRREAVGLDVPDLAARARCSPPAATACRRSGSAPHLTPGLQRREGAPDPIEGERLQRHVGGEAEGVEPGVEMDQPDGHARPAGRRRDAARCPGR